MKNLLFMDVETTGIYYDKNEVVEIACQFYQDGELKKSFHTHMNSSGDKEISLGALKVNKHDLSSFYETRETAALAFVKFLTSLPSSKEEPLYIAGHNIAFDVQAVKELLKEFNIIGWGELFSHSVVDTSTIANFLRSVGIIKMDRMSLGALAKTLGIEVVKDKLHGAEYDTEITAKVYFKMLKLLENIKFNSDNYEALCSIKEQ